MYGGLTRASTSAPRLASLHHPVTPLPRPLNRHISSFPPTSRQETERQIAVLASKPITPLTLSDLVKFGHPPLSTPALLSSAQFALSRLPIRLAHRLQALRSLPFIVVTNPHVSQIYNTYLHSLSTLLPFQDREIRSTHDERLFSDVLADLVQAHGSTITTLATGFAESKKFLGAEQVGRFLDTHLRARIGTRLIGEQHLALHVATAEAEAEAAEPAGGGQQATASPFIGVINTKIHPEKLLRSIEAFVGEICELKYGVRPALRISGTLKDRAGNDLTFTHIPVHLEYILTELLKNAFRATIENGMSREGVEVTVAIHRPELASSVGPGSDVIANEPGVSLPEEDDGPPLGTAAFSPPSRSAKIAQRAGSGSDNLSPEGLGTDEETITFRIRDRGGGIPPDVMSEIWKYSFTTVETSTVTDSVDLNMGVGMGYGDVMRAGADTKIAGMGYGLPLSRAYAEFFGGTLKVVSLFGWGCDVYLVLKGLRGVS